MPRGFENLTLSAADLAETGYSGPEPDEAPGAGFVPEGRTSELDPETAARAHLQTLLARDDREALRTLDVSPVPSGSGHEFTVAKRSYSPLTRTHSVSFTQARDAVPVFGSRAVVEMDEALKLVSATLWAAEVTGVDPDAEVSMDRAWSNVLEHLGSDSHPMPEGAELTLLPHPDEHGKVHLTWRFPHVALEPRSESPAVGHPDSRGQASPGCTHENVILEPDFDYFVDAHSGDLVFFFSNTAHLDVPAQCRGEDEDGVTQVFLGRVTGGFYLMDNPLDDVWTGDMGFRPIHPQALPTTPVRNAGSDWQGSNPAAVSAHVNATRVLDFLFRILRRNSIDDEGMTLRSYVNCIDGDAPGPRAWLNAAWRKGGMWYGQEAGSNGGYVSLSRHLDIIAHELFHGVTENTSKLAYRGLSGALNESMSDIFGVLIRNWHLAGSADVSGWNWEMGSGLGPGGVPLRDMSNPSRVGKWWQPVPGGGSQTVAGYPDHMNQYVPLPETQAYDWGGVHWYSNIHNFAAYHLLVSRRADGSYLLAPEAVGILYYLVLTRLGPLSDFNDARTELLSVASTLYGGDVRLSQEVRQAIEDAYDRVGII